MTDKSENRFQGLFETGKYVAFKNYLYSYVLRKRAIEKVLEREDYTLILEVGSGISPVMTRTDRIVYSELSFLACRTLKRQQQRGWYVAADVTHLPFCEGAFSHTVSSEVLEHVAEDAEALGELARVLAPGGRLIVTFPHRKFYFSLDDRFVEHYRRYELPEMVALLKAVGLHPIRTQKVLGPMDKVGAIAAILSFTAAQRLLPGKAEKPAGPSGLMNFLAPVVKWANRFFACLAWADARVVPRALATILLVVAEKTHADPDH